MSSDTTIVTPTAWAHRDPTVSTIVSLTIRAGILALVVNLLVKTLANTAGVELVLTPSGGAAIEIQTTAIITMTIVPVAVGGLLLVLLGRFASGATRHLAWIGVFIGLGTALMPISMGGDLTARLVLASMHAITGLAWFVSVRRIGY